MCARAYRAFVCKPSCSNLFVRSLFQICLQVSRGYTPTCHNIATYFFQLIYRWSTARKRVGKRWPTYIIQTAALYTAIESIAPVVPSKFLYGVNFTSEYAFRNSRRVSESRRNKLLPRTGIDWNHGHSRLCRKNGGKEKRRQRPLPTTSPELLILLTCKPGKSRKKVSDSSRQSRKYPPPWRKWTLDLRIRIL